MDFSLMETEDLDILLKITEIDIKLAELEEKQRKACLLYTSPSPRD